jgi:hypothetical protein
MRAMGDRSDPAMIASFERADEALRLRALEEQVNKGEVNVIEL